MSKTNKKTVEETYTKVDQHEHILLRPNMYIGSIMSDNTKLWTYENGKIINKEIQYNQGLYKIFDEILVNARDHTVNDATCKNIKISINDGIISCFNDGDNGIPIQIHKETKVYVPEMIFGQLLTSSTYESTNRIVGGVNGLGSKLSNIYSEFFEITIIDGKSKQKYVQTFKRNMFEKSEPIITKSKEKSSVMIRFKPDYKRFRMDTLTDDMYNLFRKRVYDLAACTSIKVYFNNEPIELNSFDEYIKMFYGDDAMPFLTYQKVNDRWRVGVLFDNSVGFRHVSYVNGICTFQGGTHVRYIADQVVDGIMNIITSTTKYKNIKVKPSQIRENLTVFVDAIIVDPSFDSQSKEHLKTKSSLFGSKCELDEQFIKAFSKSGIVEDVVEMAKFKQMDELKKSDGKKRGNVRIEKLDDAEWAGTRKSKQCKLILTEGDSAKSFALNVIKAIDGYQRYGVFPLRGKVINVRDTTPAKILNNKEITNIKQIIGLQQGKVYQTLEKLRYGGIIILTDQDYDGSHIKGLLINFIHFFWPSLLMNFPDFIQTMKTPIVKTWKKSDSNKANVMTFYTITEYQQWKEKIDDFNKSWIVKYYKGLGTSTKDEVFDAAKDFDKKIITFMWDKNLKFDKIDNNDIDETKSSNSNTDNEDDDNDSQTDLKFNESYEAITKSFAKSRADDRKKWLKQYNKDNILDNSKNCVTYREFFDKDFIHFSNYDCQRSIPSVCDGQKPSNRKILYGCFTKNLKSEIKVAQLAPAVAEIAAYHHGEQSLCGCIVAMAQTFVGSNNINLLMPNGNFGSRRTGGEDAASPRYIFTELNPLTTLIFRKEDAYVYDYVDDDGFKVEPYQYAPIIPMILVNGSKGIGTGFSTDVLPYNPTDIINNIKLMIEKKPLKEMMPWFRGFTGTIKKISDLKYESVGVYEHIDPQTLIIKELPIGVWTDDYLEEMRKLLADDPKNTDGFIFSNIVCKNGDEVYIKLSFIDDTLQQLIKSGKLLEKLKLTKKHSATNLHLYNSEGVIKKYDTINDIFKDYYSYRYEIYVKRREYFLRMLLNDLNIVKYKIKFIEGLISGKICLFKNKGTIKEEEIIALLDTQGYPKLSYDVNSEDKSYDYLTSMSIFSPTEERLEKLKKEYELKESKYNNYKNTTVEDLWNSELNELMDTYNKSIDQAIKKPKKIIKKATKTAKIKKTKNNKESDDD